MNGAPTISSVGAFRYLVLELRNWFGLIPPFSSCSPAGYCWRHITQKLFSREVNEVERTARLEDSRWRPDFSPQTSDENIPGLHPRNLFVASDRSCIEQELSRIFTIESSPPSVVPLKNLLAGRKEIAMETNDRRKAALRRSRYEGVFLKPRTLSLPKRKGPYLTRHFQVASSPRETVLLGVRRRSRDPSICFRG